MLLFSQFGDVLLRLHALPAQPRHRDASGHLRNSNDFTTTTTTNNNTNNDTNNTITTTTTTNTNTNTNTNSNTHTNTNDDKMQIIVGHLRRQRRAAADVDGDICYT